MPNYRDLSGNNRAGVDLTPPPEPEFVEPRLTTDVKKLASNQTNSTLTRATIGTGSDPWTFGLVADKTYRFEVIGSYQTGVTTTGMIFGIAGSGGLAGTVMGRLFVSVSQHGADEVVSSVRGLVGASSVAQVTSTGVSAINSAHQFGANFVITVTTAGNLSFEFSSEVDTSAAQINANSIVMITELTP